MVCSIKDMVIRYKVATRIYKKSTSLLENFVILTILCRVLEIPLDRFRELRQETAAFNVLCRKGDRFYAEVVNERSHLKKFKKNITC